MKTKTVTLNTWQMAALEVALDLLGKTGKVNQEGLASLSTLLINATEVKVVFKTKEK